MFYIQVFSDNNFVLKDSKYNTILETDIPISEDMFNEIQEVRTQGEVKLTLVNPYGKNLSEMFNAEIITPKKIEKKIFKTNEQLTKENEDLKKSIAELSAMMATLIQ